MFVPSYKYKVEAPGENRRKDQVFSRGPKASFFALHFAGLKACASTGYTFL